MKYKKMLFLSSSLILLGACNADKSTESSGSSDDISIESSIEESVVEQQSSETISESISEELDPVITNTEGHVFEGLVDETTFSNELGYQAWLDYVRVTEEYTLGDYGDLNNTTGSTSAEIDALFDESIERGVTEISENQKMAFYRYPDEEGGEFSEISAFLAEITFYFIDDYLVFSSVTPGFYMLEYGNGITVDTLSNLFTVEELEAIQAKVYTVSELIYNGELINQVMVAAEPLESQTNVMMNAFYFLVSGEDIFQYGYLPFEDVGQDFPTNSVLLYNSYISQQENQ